MSAGRGESEEESLARTSFSLVRHCRRGRARVRRRAASADTARYILPPGNFGGLPTTAELARPAAAVRRPDPAARQRRPPPTSSATSCPRTSSRSAPPARSTTGRPGLRLVYDTYGIPHVYGKTRDDLAFGAGWTTARDRGLLMQLGRGPARVAVADVPGINAFCLVTSGAVASPRARRPRRWSPSSRSCSSKTYGAKGRADPRRRPGLRRRHQRLLEANQTRPCRRPTSTT